MRKAAPKRATRKRTDPPAVQPPANPDRGEHELTLAEVVYRLRPSHTALKAIEKKTERTILALTRLGNVGEVSLVHLGIIAAELIRAGAEDEMTRRVDADRISELIMEEGILAANTRLTLCLLDAATGGRDAEGNVKAATA